MICNKNWLFKDYLQYYDIYLGFKAGSIISSPYLYIHLYISVSFLSNSLPLSDTSIIFPSPSHNIFQGID